jgi:tetratricopeptide (TPR) repeat protein
VWVPALFAGVFLLGGMTVGAVYLAQPRPTPAVEEPKTPRAEEPDKRPSEDKQLAEERRQLEEERRQLEEDKKRLAFARRMREAEEALTKKQYAAAEKAYTEALKLYPDDADARNGLTAAKTSALASEAASANAKEERQKRDAEVARLMEQGKAAMGKKEFAAAVRAFTVAKQLAPDDADVGKALEGALASADADAGEKKKLADYQVHLDAGRAALTAGRFEEAVREFQAALNVLPDDQTAAINLKTAQNRLAAGAEMAKRQEAYAELMQRAQAALDAGRPDQAVPPLKQAAKLFPDDKNTQKMLKTALLDASTAEAEYNRLMALGDAAMSRQRFEEANRLYTQAGQALPGDRAAADKARAAANAVTDRQAAIVAYQRYMTQAALDMENQRYPSAVRNFQEALRIVPGDANALQGLTDARSAIAAATRQRGQLDTLLQKGATALQQLQYAEAITIYTDALRLAPGDPRATRGLSQARYGRAMVQGRVALAANRNQDAIRYFEEALEQAPGDPAAMALLAQARVRRK